MRGRLPQPVVVLVGAYIVLAELDRLLGACLGADGAPATAGGLFGPFGIGVRNAWDTWHSSAWSGVAARVLLLHLLVDIVFYLAYTRLLRAWLSTFTSSGAATALRAVRVVLVLEVAETAVAALCLAFLGDGFLDIDSQGPGGGVPEWLRRGLGVVTEAKWTALVALGFIVVRLVGDTANRSRAVATIRRWATALYYQRLSLLVVVVIGALALNPGAGVSDQIPDVLRHWADLSATATRHLVAGILGTALTAVGLFVLGRLRTERAWCEYVSRNVRKSRRPSLVWLIWPLVALTAGLLLLVTGEQESLDWRFWLAVGVPLAIFIVSWIAFTVGGTAGRAARWWPLVPLPRADRQFAETTWRAGDALAGGVVLLLALALLRAFTAPVVLGPIPADDPFTRSRQWMEVGMLATGVLLAVIAQPVLGALRDRVDDGLRRGAETYAETGPGATGRRYRWSALWPPEPSGGAMTPWARVTLGCALAVLVVVELWPLRATAFLGVFATTQLVLLAWAVFIGVVLVQLQHHQPAEVFRILRLRQNPVMTLVLAVLCVSSLRGGDAGIHALRTLDPSPAPTGPTQVGLAGFTRTWLGAGADCGFTLPASGSPNLARAGAAGVTVRPMLLVAADGGGIRASRWTVEAMTRLNDAWRAGNPRCPRSAVLLASGVSGGSVGLALSRTDDATTAQRALEEPDALGAATAGLLLRDLVAGGFSLKVPALDAGGTWADRAGLMETVWERDSRALRERFSSSGTSSSAEREGALLLNSVATGSGCRVLVGQVDVRRPATLQAASPEGDGRRVESRAATVETPGPDCRTRTDLPAGTFDLLQSYRACLPGISWATAAMLSARFPVVTPAGRLEGCRPTLADLQLIDGGYAEGSGLGTLTEVAQDVLDAVRTANSAATGPTRTIVVPIVVFLQNRPGADVSTPPPGLSAELFVPLAGRAAETLQGSTGSWLQRAAAELDQACLPDDAVCQATLATVWRTVPGGVVVVAPAAQPTVEPPLGWTLSAASRLRLTTAMSHEAQVCRDGATSGILGGYGRLGALLTWLREHRACE